MHFDKKGKENTDETLRLAAKRAGELGIEELVLASKRGDSAYRALEICKGLKIICVSYHAGFREPFKLDITEEARRDLESKGVRVICATHALSGVERGLAKKIPGPYPVMLVAETLRLFGQGTKVAVEVSVMAADSGALAGDRIVAVRGTSEGCDTALVLTPVCQSAFLDLRVNEIICKPNLYE